MSDLGFLCNEPSMLKGLTQEITQEINKIIEQCYSSTYEYLKLHRSYLDTISEALLERETLNFDELNELVGQLPSIKKPLKETNKELAVV